MTISHQSLLLTGTKHYSQTEDLSQPFNHSTIQPRKFIHQFQYIKPFFRRTWIGFPV